MKKIITLFVAMFLALTLLGSVPANASVQESNSNPIRCKQGVRWGAEHINDGSVGADEWDLRTRMVYNYCRQGNRDWVVPLYATHSYEFEADSMSCAWWYNPSSLKWISFQTTFIGGNGREVEAMEIAIRCNRNATASFTQHFGGVGRFVYKYRNGDVIMPRFRVDYSARTAGYLNQFHGHYGARFSKVR